MNPGGAGGVTGPGGNAKAVGINQIPAQLIERVDVLTGSAPAIYGADAVAGVINFFLNTHYQGVKIGAQYDFNNHCSRSLLIDSRRLKTSAPKSATRFGHRRSCSAINRSVIVREPEPVRFAATTRTEPRSLFQWSFLRCFRAVLHRL